MSSHIVHADEEYLYLGEFEPKFLNYEKGLFEKIHIEIVWLEQLNLFRSKCLVTFREASRIKEVNVYRYTVNKIISHKEELFNIHPIKTDIFDLHFKTELKNYYIHCEKINKERIIFDTSYKLLEQFVDSEVYNISLTLPFSKHRLSGILKHISGDVFCFEEYLLDEELYNELVKYSEECFIYDYHVKTPIMDPSQTSKGSSKRNL